MRWTHVFRRFADKASGLLSRGEVSSTESPEQPLFDEVVVFYNQVFDLGLQVNPTEAARTLLREDFALAAPNYLTNEVEVAARFKKLRHLQRYVEELSELQQRLDRSDIRGFAWWVLRHPIRSLRLWWSARSYRSSLTSGRGGEEVREESENIKVSGSSNEATTEDTMSFVNEAMSRLGLMESIQRHVDRDLFTPQYLQGVPFTRISLQPFNATLAGEKIGVDVGLLIHRTGIAILTFYVMFAGRKSAEELLRLENIASEQEIEELRVVRAVVEPWVRSYGIQPSQLDNSRFEREYSSGVEWLTYRDDEKGSLVDVFNLYKTATVATLQDKVPTKPDQPWSWMRTPEWLIYPIVFARRIIPAVTDGMEFRKLYPGVIAGLIQRTHWQGLIETKIQELAEEDLSIKRDYSLYIGAGHTNVFYFEPRRQALIEKHGEDIPGQDWLHSHFQSSILLDVLLIQRWILTVFNRQFGSLTSDLTELNSLKRDLLFALEDYHDVSITYRSAQQLVRNAREKMGIDELYQGLMQKTSILERLIEVEETRRRSWRDRLLRAGTAAVTLLLGLPAASRVTEVISSWSTTGQANNEGRLTTVFNDLVEFVAAHSTSVTIAIYLVLLCIVLPWIVLSISPLRKGRPIVDTDQSQPAYKRGFTWHEGIKWREQPFKKKDKYDKRPLP